MRLLFTVISILCIEVFTSAQCYPDRHSTNWFDGWVSCTAAMNPNTEHGMSHWILYDFGSPYQLGQMKVWNTNDPEHLDWGIREAIIDVSLDGIQWTTVGEFVLSQASGSPIYEGSSGPDLDGVEGRFVLITAKNNWGGECFGLSELRIAAEETILSSIEDPEANACISLSAFPNPFVEYTDILIESRCPAPYAYQVYDMLGRIVETGVQPGGVGSVRIHLDLHKLPQGTYQIHVTQDGIGKHLTLVKLQKS